MKLIKILKSCSIPGSPRFEKGQEVRVSDKVAQDLSSYKFAKIVENTPREVVKQEKAKKNNTDREKVIITKK